MIGIFYGKTLTSQSMYTLGNVGHAATNTSHCINFFNGFISGRVDRYNHDLDPEPVFDLDEKLDNELFGPFSCWSPKVRRSLIFNFDNVSYDGVSQRKHFTPSYLNHSSAQKAHCGCW